jgi:hypothetical protein
MEDPSAFTAVKERALSEKTKAASREILVRLVNAKSGNSFKGIQFWTSRPFFKPQTLSKSLFHNNFKIHLLRLGM